MRQTITQQSRTHSMSTKVIYDKNLRLCRNPALSNPSTALCSCHDDVHNRRLHSTSLSRRQAQRQTQLHFDRRVRTITMETACNHNEKQQMLAEHRTPRVRKLVRGTTIYTLWEIELTFLTKKTTFTMKTNGTIKRRKISDIELPENKLPTGRQSKECHPHAYRHEHHHGNHKTKKKALAFSSLFLSLSHTYYHTRALSVSIFLNTHSYKFMTKSQVQKNKIQ